MSLSFLPGHRFSSAEPLESRIAPAVILVGVPNSAGGNDVDYDDAAYFHPLSGSGAAGDYIAQQVGGAAGVSNGYYLVLNKGDVLRVYNGGAQPTEVLNVKSGRVIAFFQDDVTQTNGINEVSVSELKSLALSANANVSVSAELTGDIVALVNPDGRLNLPNTVTNQPAQFASTNYAIGAIAMGGGGLAGKILAGGNISNVDIRGSVGGIYAGSQAEGKTFDFFPGVAGGEGEFDYTAAPRQVGASITNVSIRDNVVDGIYAGDGGTGALGGSLTKISVQSDVNGLTLKAGNGGNALPTAGNGGIGGTINGIYLGGVPDSTAGDFVQIVSGDGGDAPVGVGGRGGAVSSVYVGYDLAGGRPSLTVLPFLDSVSITSGTGGDGRTAGNGGAISKVQIEAAQLDSFGDEISIFSGAGGNALDPKAAKAGAGGNISDLLLRNTISQSGFSLASMVVQAGNGGVAVGAALGGAGGSINGLTFLGSELSVQAGQGTSGRIGGAGGSISNVTVLQTDILAHELVFNAGAGGSGTSGAGGNGGNLSNMVVTGAFSVLSFNGLFGAADGGDSVGAKGGKGGSLSGIIVEGSDSPAYTGTMDARTGVGGDGGLGGGAGGGISSVALQYFNLNGTISAGNGGSALERGAGGAGGSLNKVEVDSRGLALGVPPSLMVMAGDGGNASGLANGSGAGAGGAGGSHTSVNLNTRGKGVLQAGDGGEGVNVNGLGSAAGAGGSIITSVLSAGLDSANPDIILSPAQREDLGRADMIAGDAGVTGNKPAAGGSIRGFSPLKLSVLLGSSSLQMLAGDGSNGGAGGAIAFAGFGSSEQDLLPTPRGNITVLAGNGSGYANYVGNGGSITNLSGTVTSGDNLETIIMAGDGGSTLNRGGLGGDINILRIERGPDDFSPGGVLTIEAGDGGDATQARAGARGGSVSNVKVLDVGANTLIRSIAAGDGGDASFANGKGGVGGSITKVDVGNYDIGQRTGATYGYDSMGGLFAGVAGAGGVSSTAGSITYVTANSISAIVAGRSAAPQLVDTVSNIKLFGLAPLQTVNTTQFGASFTLSFGGDTTVPLNGNALPSQVEAALNLLPAIINAGGVDVLATDTASYEVTFRQDGNKVELTGQTLLSGFTTVKQEGSVTSQEIQNVDLRGTGSFVLNYDGFATSALPVGASALQVESALDQIFGPDVVSVTEAGNGSYDIVFNSNGPRTNITATETGELVTGTLFQGDVNVREIQVVNFPVLRAQSSFAFDVDGTQVEVTVPAGTSRADLVNLVQNAVNGALVGNSVNVTFTPNNTFRFDFTGVGDPVEITGVELLPTTVSAVATGGSSTQPVAETVNGDDFTQEQQSFSVLATSTFTLNFQGQETPVFNAATATADDIAVALNALSGISNLGGVFVDGSPTGGITITFNQVGDVAPLQITVSTPATQRVDLNGAGPFQLAFGTDPADRTVELAPNASAQDVQTALNAIAGPGETVTVIRDPEVSNAFLVVFNTPGAQPLIIAREEVALNSSTLVDGSGAVQEVQLLQLQNLNPFDAERYFASNLVGAIADFNEFGAARFKFIDTDGDSKYDLSEIPLDGILLAKNFSQRTSNFAPEASFIINTDSASPRAGLYRPVAPGTEYYDNLNPL